MEELAKRIVREVAMAAFTPLDHEPSARDLEGASFAAEAVLSRIANNARWSQRDVAWLVELSEHVCRAPTFSEER